MHQKIDNFTPKLSQPFSELNATFGIENAIVEFEEPTEYAIVDSTENPITVKERDDDFSTVRETLHRIMQKAENSLDNIQHVAKQSEHPRAYEVVANLVSTVTDVANKLLELHERKAKIETITVNGASPVIEQQNNIVFHGRPQDLLDTLKDLN